MWLQQPYTQLIPGLTDVTTTYTMSCYGNRRSVTSLLNVSLCHVNFKLTPPSSDLITAVAQLMKIMSHTLALIVGKLSLSACNVFDVINRDCTSKKKIWRIFLHIINAIAFLPSSWLWQRNDYATNAGVSLPMASAIQRQQLPTIALLSIKAWTCGITHHMTSVGDMLHHVVVMWPC